VTRRSNKNRIHREDAKVAKKDFKKISFSSFEKRFSFREILFGFLGGLRVFAVIHSLL